VLQAGLFVLASRDRSMTEIAAGLSALSLLTIGIWVWRRSLWAAIPIMTVLPEAVVLVFSIATDILPLSYRLLQIAIILLYAIAGTAMLLFGCRIKQGANILLLVISLAVTLFAAEVGLGWVAARRAALYGAYAAEHVVWAGPVATHPILGQYVLPYTTLRTYYPDNPRNYFVVEQPSKVQWTLSVDGNSSAAHLVFKDGGYPVRVEITRGEVGQFWHIHMDEPSLTLQRDVKYSLSFRVKADAKKRFAYSVGQTNSPWKSLGLYEEIDATPQWQTIETDFVSPAYEPDARIHFDVGGSAISIEFADVRLVALPARTPVEPRPAEPHYFVEYKMNDRGCRGRNYPVQKTPGTERILILGDSYAMGVGVHEQDVVSSRLERLLNERAQREKSAATYEVINCGFTGWGTREERYDYELFAHEYHPDAVLVLMVSNDDRSWVDDVKLGYYRVATKYEGLSLLWGSVQQVRHQAPKPDFRVVVAELLKLNDLVNRDGGRLAAIAFRHEGSDVFADLVRTVQAGLAPTSIPFLDLGPVLLKYPDSQLIVHPVDRHPNEFAHGIAAKEIFGFLDRTGLVAPTKMSAR
jgi:hypothetical protein